MEGLDNRTRIRYDYFLTLYTLWKFPLGVQKGNLL